MIKSGVSNSIIINFELVNTPNIRDLEYRLVYTIRLLLQSCADEGINAHKLQLDIVGIKWLPFAILELFNFNPVYNSVCDSVSVRGLLLSFAVVVDVANAQTATLSERPWAKVNRQSFVA